MAIKHSNPIAAWIFYVQYNKGITKAKISKAMGINGQTIYDWARGKRKPGIRKLASMVELSDGKFTKEMLRPDLFEG